MEPLTWIPFFLYPEQLKLVAVYQIRSMMWLEWSIKRVPPNGNYPWGNTEIPKELT